MRTTRRPSPFLYQLTSPAGRRGGRVWEVLTMRYCLHHDPSLSVHTILSTVELWDLSLRFNCRQMFPLIFLRSSISFFSLSLSRAHMLGPDVPRILSGTFWDCVPAVVLVYSHHPLVRASPHPSAVPFRLDCQDSAGLEAVRLLMKLLAEQRCVL